MLLNAFYCAVVSNALIWCMDDGMVFSFYRQWLEKKAFEWQYGFLTKPLGLCSFCLTGQLSFWSAIFSGLYPVEIITMTCLGLFFDKLINKW